jgi:hypothetical protein
MIKMIDFAKNFRGRILQLNNFFKTSVILAHKKEVLLKIKEF